MLAQIVLYDGFDPLDALLPYEVLAAGGALSGGKVEAELVSAEGPREVRSGFEAIRLSASAALDPSRADVIVVPGAAGSLPDGDEPAEDSILGYLQRAVGSALTGLMADALDRRGVTVTTVCGGSMLLAMAGLIKGRAATTNHFGPGLAMLAETGVNAIDARLVDDGDLITAAGVSSGLDLGLYLLERDLGPQVAHTVGQLFEHERRGTVWRATGAKPLNAESASLASV
jgi:transcriptional regulator GlxA family with amidase domain